MPVPDAQRNAHSISYNVVYGSFLYCVKEVLRILPEFTMETNRIETVKGLTSISKFLLYMLFNESSLFLLFCCSYFNFYLIVFGDSKLELMCTSKSPDYPQFYRTLDDAWKSTFRQSVHLREVLIKCYVEHIAPWCGERDKKRKNIFQEMWRFKKNKLNDKLYSLCYLAQGNL